MASITIRQLDDDLKHRLRLRAARNGRSMEEEARIILGDAAALKAKAGARPASSGCAGPQRRNGRRAAEARSRDGHKTRCPDHWRRNCSVQVARSHPPAERARACRALHSHPRGTGIHHASVGERALGRARHSRTCSTPRPSSTSATSGWRARLTLSWWRRRPLTSSPGWRGAMPTISLALCCSPPTARYWWRRR